MESPKLARWKQRILVFEAIYSDLLIENNNKENIVNICDWKEFETKIYNNYLKNKEKYLCEIQNLLKDGWTVDRLNVPLLALIIETMAEFHEIGTKIPILLHQSVLTSRAYCGDNEYKMANGLLQNYLKKF